MFDFDSLEPHIRTILSAPGVDLKTVSAKRVRKELIGREPELTADFIKENKAEIDAVIGRVFEQVNPPDQESEAEEEPDEEPEVKPAEKPSRKRKLSGDDEDEGTEGQTGDDDEEEDEQEEKPKPKKKKKASSSIMSDAELARKLSGEINGRARRTKARNTSPRKQKKKSAATVDSDDEDGEEGGKKKKKKASGGGGGAKGGFAKEFALSEPLSAVLNEQKLSRPQVVKQLWVYIKANELQNPSNKREIVCDDALRRVFNTDKIDMFKMNKELGSHLYDAVNS
ncbi:hypothetical protein GGF50DRAFT_123527 [Schizophyllum commune]